MKTKGFWLVLQYTISCSLLYITGRKYEPVPRAKGYSLLFWPHHSAWPLAGAWWGWKHLFRKLLFGHPLFISAVGIMLCSVLTLDVCSGCSIQGFPCWHHLQKLCPFCCFLHKITNVLRILCLTNTVSSKSSVQRDFVSNFQLIGESSLISQNICNDCTSTLGVLQKYNIF